MDEQDDSAMQYWQQVGQQEAEKAEMERKKMTTTKLSDLRKPFPAHQINKLPKPTPAQTDAVKKDYKQGHRCQECGQWHAKGVVHLDYVGHAALTDRLLDVDPAWTWEPLSLGQDGYPVIDKNGGMWIKLTICGVTRLGYGDAQGKTGGNAIKECIGDALRNAAMRFGAALDLWHKGELHVEDAPTIDQQISDSVIISDLQKVWKSLSEAEQTEYLDKFTAKKISLTPKEAA